MSSDVIYVEKGLNIWSFPRMKIPTLSARPAGVMTLASSCLRFHAVQVVQETV